MANMIKSGIPGLDKILKGGIRRDSATLFTGAPGTGKTLAAIQFIYNGIKDCGENGIFITAEETPGQLKDYAESIGLDLGKYEKEGKVLIIEKPVTYLKGGIASITGLLELIEKRKVKRMALDSLTFFEYLYPPQKFDRIEFRRQVLTFTQSMKKMGITILATAEKSVTDLDRLEYQMMDFLFDTLVILTRIRKGSYFERCLSVIKAKGQEHSLDIYPTTIEKGGLKVLPDQVPFSLVEQEEEKK